MFFYNRHNITKTDIDYVKKGLNSELVFNNPNISAKCGCGESFSIDQNLFNQA